MIQIKIAKYEIIKYINEFPKPFWLFVSLPFSLKTWDLLKKNGHFLAPHWEQHKDAA